MPHTNTAVRVAGTWLAIASSLLIAALVVHGPLAPDLSHQMKKIADGAMAWSMIHWVSAASLSLYAVTGLIVLTSGSRLAEGWWTMTAWAVLTVSALWTMTTAVVEATVVTNAAVAGAKEMFEAWWAFAEGKASGIAFFALAVAVISGNEAQSSERAVPAWSAWIAMAERGERTGAERPRRVESAHAAHGLCLPDRPDVAIHARCDERRAGRAPRSVGRGWRACRRRRRRRRRTARH